MPPPPYTSIVYQKHIEYQTLDSHNNTGYVKNISSIEYTYNISK